MTKENLERFKEDIIRVCQHYGVLIRRQGEKRDNPRPDAIFYYEFELSAKITPQNGDWISETENGRVKS